MAARRRSAARPTRRARTRRAGTPARVELPGGIRLVMNRTGTVTLGDGALAIRVGAGGQPTVSVRLPRQGRRAQSS